jgi:hypothetical protein
MRRDSIVLFLLAFLMAVISISQLVQTVKHANEMGGMVWVQAILFGILFVVSMAMLAFGLYTSEDERGKVVKRVAFFDRLLNKEKK